jgi:hypothetical protein
LKTLLCTTTTSLISVTLTGTTVALLVTHPPAYRAPLHYNTVILSQSVGDVCGQFVALFVVDFSYRPSNVPYCIQVPLLGVLVHPFHGEKVAQSIVICGGLAVVIAGNNNVTLIEQAIIEGRHVKQVQQPLKY